MLPKIYHAGILEYVVSQWKKEFMSHDDRMNWMVFSLMVEIKNICKTLCHREE